MTGQAWPAPATAAAEGPLRRHAAWLLVLLAYVYAFPYFERLNNPNENARIWATRAIVEHHVLNIDRMQQEWGYVNDKAKSETHVYSGKAPGSSFLGVPVLFVHTKLRHLFGRPSPSKREATLWLRVFTVELPLCLFLFFFAGHVQRASGSTAVRDLLVVALGAGTLIFPYGHMVAGHAQAAALAFSAYMLLDQADRSAAPARSSAARLAWAGFLTSATVVFEYQAVLVSALLAGYALVRYRRKAAVFFAGAVPPAFALGLYHTVLFGRPWRFPFGNVENPEYLRTAHTAGFHGLALPKLPAIVGSLFAPDYGLFVFSPVLALGAVCAVVLCARGRRRDGILALAIAVVMLLFLSGMSNWRAGWCAGPRYIASVAPFLVAPIAQLWPLVRGRARAVLAVLAAGLTIPSVALNVVSGALYPHYPPQLDNPIFDLALPLLRAGYVPYSLGLLVGLRGLWSLAPMALAVVAALALGVLGVAREAAGPPARRSGDALGRVAVALAVAALVLVPLSRYGRRPNPVEDTATAVVRSLWEPAPAPLARR
jgi:hypothetical protein